MSTSRYKRFLMGLALGGYSIFRIALIAPAGPLAGGFTHDSAYNAIVAAQVRDGHGYVNPASWLVFLNPQNLPMPFHNANPGYLTAIAAVSRLSGMDVFRAGFLISALSNVLLAFAVYLLVRRFSESSLFSALCAIFAASSPVHIQDSLSYVPDALSTALTVLCLALLVRARFAWAGVVFGLAWLCRSTAVFCLPGILVYLFWKCGKKGGTRTTAGFLLAALAVSSPWLIHTARVWGSPFRSDGAYYLLQNYYARLQGHGDVERYWLSLEPPPSLSSVLRHDPVGLAGQAVRGVPKLVYWTLYGWSGANKPVALLLITLFVLAAFRLRKLLWTAEGAAVLVTCLTTFGALSVRANSLEIRYLGPCTVLLSAGSLAALLPSVERRLRPMNATEGVLAATVALLLVAWPLQDWSLFRDLRGVRQETAELKDVCLEVDRSYAHGGRVLMYRPYFYALFTGASALSIPDTGKQQLIAYMHRYQASFLILEKPAATKRHPDLAPEFRQVADFPGRTLLQLEATP